MCDRAVRQAGQLDEVGPGEARVSADERVYLSRGAVRSGIRSDTVCMARSIVENSPRWSALRHLLTIRVIKVALWDQKCH